MTTPEIPKLNEPSPVLGVDPPAPTPTAPVAPPVTHTPVPGPETIQVDADEYARLQEAAGNYNTLTQDEQLQAVIYGHLRDRAAGIVNPEVTPAAAPPVDPTGNPLETRMVRVEQFLQQGAQHIQQQNGLIQRQADEIASMRTDRFAEQNPSFKAHEIAVAKIAKEHGLSLPDALMLVEARAVRAGNGTVDGGHPATPTTEGAGAGSLPNQAGGNTDEARLADLAERINDPKATPSMDAALDAIGDAFGVNG